MKIGDDIAYSRNMAKVHYPSDSKFGKELGDELYDFISNSGIRETLTNEDIESLVNKKLAPLTNLNLGDVSEEEEIKEVKNKYGIDVAHSSRLNEKGKYLSKTHKSKRIKIKESTLERMITRLISESRLLKNKTRR